MRKLMIACFVGLLITQSAAAYGPLTHEALIDSTWKDYFVRALLQKFPRTTKEQLLEARKYAYGGCIIQDMGYYPFGTKFFTNLLHYVRSADFIEALLEESQNVNEYAFALGALSHYVSDVTGHRLATNLIVPMLYPELQARFGDVVTFEQKPSAHIKVEFGYDVLQVARGQYAPEAYHDFIGFDVSKPVLERAFLKTYGLEMSDVFLNEDLAIGTFRRTVSDLIPQATRIAWDLKHDEILVAAPDVTQTSFQFSMTRAAYEQKWGVEYEKPGFFARAFGFFVRLFQKVGLFKSLDFKPPTAETERIFNRGYQATQLRYKELLTKLGRAPLVISNLDLDTGVATKAGEYRLADLTYAELVQKLAEKHFTDVSAKLKQNIIAFYSDRSPLEWEKNHKNEWAKLQKSLEQLKIYSAPES